MRSFKDIYIKQLRTRLRLPRYEKKTTSGRNNASSCKISAQLKVQPFNQSEHERQHVRIYKRSEQIPKLNDPYPTHYNEMCT